MSIDVSAENEVQISKLSAFTTKSFYGDTLSCNYSINGVRYSSDLTYFGCVYAESSGNAGGGRGVWSGMNGDPDSFFTRSYQDYDVILYATEPLGAVTLEDVTIYGCDTYFGEYARGCFAASVNNGFKDNPVNNSNLISAYPDNYFDSFHAISANYEVSSILADYYGVSTIFFNNDYNIGLRMIPYEFTNGGSVQSIHFDSIGVGSYGHFIFAIICPYVGGSMANRPPVTVTTTDTTSTTTGTSVNVNVNVDMTETNGLLQDIISALSSVGSFIVNGVKDLFLPDTDDITNWKQTIVNILNETFGGIPELENQLKDAISSIFTATARQTVTFKGIKVPAAAGQPEAIIVPEQEVALRPPGFDNLFSWAETFINIVATIAVANTCFNQIKRIVVGEVVIDAD